MNKVKTHDYVKDNNECKPIIINTLTAMYNLNTNNPVLSDRINPLARPRLPYSILFAIGGWSGGSPTNAIETYDTRADKWGERYVPRGEPPCLPRNCFSERLRLCYRRV